MRDKQCTLCNKYYKTGDVQCIDCTAINCHEKYRPKTREELEAEFEKIYNNIYKGCIAGTLTWNWYFKNQEDVPELKELFYQATKRIER